MGCGLSRPPPEFDDDGPVRRGRGSNKSLNSGPNAKDARAKYRSGLDDSDDEGDVSNYTEAPTTSLENSSPENRPRTLASNHLGFSPLSTISEGSQVGVASVSSTSPHISPHQAPSSTRSSRRTRMIEIPEKCYLLLSDVQIQELQSALRRGVNINIEDFLARKREELIRQSPHGTILKLPVPVEPQIAFNLGTRLAMTKDDDDDSEPAVGRSTRLVTQSSDSGHPDGQTSEVHSVSSPTNATSYNHSTASSTEGGNAMSDRSSSSGVTKPALTLEVSSDPNTVDIHAVHLEDDTEDPSDTEGSTSTLTTDAGSGSGHIPTRTRHRTAHPISGGLNLETPRDTRHSTDSVQASPTPWAVKEQMFKSSVRVPLLLPDEGSVDSVPSLLGRSGLRSVMQDSKPRDDPKLLLEVLEESEHEGSSPDTVSEVGNLVESLSMNHMSSIPSFTEKPIYKVVSGSQTLTTSNWEIVGTNLSEIEIAMQYLNDDHSDDDDEDPEVVPKHVKANHGNATMDLGIRVTPDDDDDNDDHDEEGLSSLVTGLNSGRARSTMHPSNTSPDSRHRYTHQSGHQLSGTRGPQTDRSGVAAQRHIKFATMNVK